MKLYTYITVLFVYLWFSTVGISQVTADFTSNTTLGCAPLLINFQDLSTGNIVWRYWSFGNGNNSIGNNLNPDNIYNNSGFYTVTLTVSDGVDTATVTKTSYIQALAAPVVNFSHQTVTSGCAVFPFSVADSSAPSGSPIVSWSWDFDDGTGAVTGQNVTHNYSSSGTFGVTLTVTDNQGCSSSLTKPNLVQVDQKPVASFVPQGPISACAPPLTVTLNNTSTGTAPLSYNWNFAGVNYTSTNVTQTFTQFGGYNVSLIVTNSLGCSDTINKPNYVYVGNVQAAFNLPDSACPGTQVTMFDNSLGGNTFTWDFGDGTSGVGSVVNHSYNSAGNYTVKMVASAGVGCTDSVTKVIHIELVTAAFTSNPHYACEAPLIVQFTDQSIGNIVSWFWNFGSSDSSTLQNPVNTYLTSGFFDDTLTVVSALGCSNTLIAPNNEQILITQADFVPNIVEGCFPLTVNFTNTTTPIAQIGTIIWEFDDGSPNTNTSSPTHTFMLPGEYFVQLTIVSVDGCTTMVEQEIRVGSHQVPNFGIDTLIACGSDTVNFFNYSSDTALINEYIWNFGDGTASSDFLPNHVFLDTGYLDITLIVGYNGCMDTLMIDSMIQILGPVVTFGPLMNCDTPNIVAFFGSSKGGTDLLWNFGDSTAQDSINWQVTHVYPPFDGNYDVDLFVYDSITGCSMTKTNSVHIRYLEGVLVANDTSVCRGDKVFLNTNSSTNALGFVDWGFNTLNSLMISGSTNSYILGQNGVWDIYAIVHDENGCKDTLVQPVYVFKPTANFTYTPPIGCSPLLVNFTDISLTDTNIVSWDWSFGDGTSSTLQNPSHVYASAYNWFYTVQLTVEDTFGCVDWKKVSSAVMVQNPPSSFKALNLDYCAGEDVIFYGVPTGSYTYFWDFGDGDTSTITSPTHTYAAGNYTVSLTVTNAFGCDSTYTRVNYIKVQDYPIANFTANPTFSTCYPTNVVFTDSSIVQNAATWTWSFGDSPNFVILTDSTAQNLYTQPGVYDVTLIVTTTFGCADTITKTNYIDIHGPTANVLVNPAIGCVGQPVEFYLDQLNAEANYFLWGFGDGFADTTTSPNPDVLHTYFYPGSYNVVLIFSDSLGLCTKIDTVTFVVDEVVSDFFVTDSTGCTPLGVTMFSQSIGEDNWRWKVDGVFSSSLDTNSIVLTNPGFHDIQLYVWNSISSCADSITKSVEVYPLPNINAGPDKVVCIGSSVQLHASGGIEYVWSPATFLNDTMRWNPYTTPLNDITYTVKGADDKGCVNFDSINIQVQYHPELLLFPSDTSIFNGEEYHINTMANMPLMYTWSPPVFLDCTTCSDPVADPTGTTTFQLVYSDTNGCFVYDTSFVIEVSDEFNINIPNAFTPNWDGDNDTFKAATFGIEELVYMRIFNRWGQMVFETTDLNEGWDGRVKGEIAAHNTVFTYTIKVRRFNGDEKEFLGMVVLISR